ncbi:ATP-dependent helicase HrpA [Naumannella cuiyingiana]|uniref:ATP-dependent helicase HrpA n=1 Tax=Naumannella cuiyingiana TaxID=1347891 RepID=A0A7Z0IME1_9ACTN|nr:ATP-dependent RNA helicase HrpA [Naumannella cuiyingiana]NYI72531.1 ATP-dependent helicase HrpA [Naumannella cuiyingiana]
MSGSVQEQGPVLAPDPELPVSARADDIAAALREHQVVVVAGETGSGKTTQLPKICLAAGRRSIAHTQPRRIAARTVAERIAEETRTELGDLVGYQVRFTRRAGRDTRLKIMTDGVLLAEIGRDRDLRRYDTIIIDEAHERSLNIDFLLGYLKQLIARRPELRVIITSATIDTDRFSRHFDDAPVIEVSGRTHPVDIRYRPDDGAEEGQADPIGAITAAVDELIAEGPGDILIFLSGEREIRDTADALAAAKLPDTEVLPLYARLSAAEQHRVFRPHRGRRIVLATNVAETSLTVPGIRYVIDPGTARISRYSARTKVQRLPIEPISQASANQRAGRAGRTSPGIAIRLYGEDDFAARPEFTEPEMLRTNLASVILQMAAAGLGEIRDFPFVEAPDAAAIGDGLRLLHELGALRGKPGKGPVRLSRIGQQLARMPIDPRLGRMLIAAAEQGALAEVLIIVAGLSIQDPRERPAEHRERADELHRRFWAPVEPGPAAGAPGEDAERSDFLAWLNLWNYLTERQRSLSGNAFRRMCRDEFLHFLRIREWQDLHGQLRGIARDLDLATNAAPAPPDRVHLALLSGLLSNVGLADLREPTRRSGDRGRRRPGPREYLGTRGSRFAINPGSALARTPPELVMAAELVETGRLWARTVAPITADQVEEAGGHLLTRTWSEPHFSARSGAVLARERVALLGVPIRNDKMINYGRIDPAAAREIFIRSGLVEGELRTQHGFLAHNRAIREQAEEVGTRLRRPGLVDDQTLFDLYDARLGPEITSVGHLDAWLRRQPAAVLDFSVDDLIGDADPDAGAFPAHWRIADLELDVRYVYEPGAGHDGVLVDVDLAVLHRLSPAPFSWQVPGLRVELATATIKSLPKPLRTSFVPAPEYAGRALAEIAGLGIDPERVPFADALARALTRLAAPVEPSDFDPTRLPTHLVPTFVIRGDDGAELDSGPDLAALQRRLTVAAADSLTAAVVTERPLASGQTQWSFGEIPTETATGPAVGHPGLTDEGAAVGMRIFPERGPAEASHRRGIARLLVLTTPNPANWVIGRLGNADKLALTAAPYPGLADLVADARLRAVADLAARVDDPAAIRDEAAFAALREAVRAEAAEETRRVVAIAAETVRAHGEVLAALGERPAGDDAAEDVREQVRNLIFDGFLAATPQPWLGQLPRYLRAAARRLAALPGSAARDERAAAEIWPLEDAYAELVNAQPEGPLSDEVAEIGWLLEELRVSLFAQSLGTRVPVSAKRVRSAIARAAHR